MNLFKIMSKRKKISISIIILIIIAFGIFYLKDIPRKRKNLEYLKNLSEAVYNYQKAYGQVPEQKFSQLYNDIERPKGAYPLSYGKITNTYYYIRSFGPNGEDNGGEKDDIEVTHINGEFIVGTDNIRSRIYAESDGGAEGVMYDFRDAHY